MDENPNQRRDEADGGGADGPRPAGLLSARRWFTAMGFPLIILAAVLAWEGYRTSTGETGPTAGQGRVVLYYVAAAVCFGLGLAAVRMRHRSDRR